MERRSAEEAVLRLVLKVKGGKWLCKILEQNQLKNCPCEIRSFPRCFVLFLVAFLGKYSAFLKLFKLGGFKKKKKDSVLLINNDVFSSINSA